MYFDCSILSRLTGIKNLITTEYTPRNTDDGGFSSKDKKSLGIALTSCAVAVIAIVIAMFTVLVCSRSKDKETTGSESGLVPERSRREPDNLSRLFEARPKRQNMSAL